MKRRPLIRIFLLLLTVCTLGEQCVSQSLGLSSISPLSANAGASVTVTGWGFSPAIEQNIVFFGPVRGEVTAASSTQLSVTVPKGAGYGPLSVTVNGSTVFSQRSFDHSFQGIGRIVDGMFSDRVDVPPSNSGPNALLLADIDGDASSDLVVHYRFGGSLGIYRSTGPRDTINENQFSTEADYATGYFPNTLHRADVNNDGKPDIISIPSMSEFISVFVNSSSFGAVEFAPRHDIPFNHSGTKFSAVEDMDGDGKTDIALCVTESNEVYLYRNVSSISTVAFEYGGSYSCPSNTSGLLVTDLDGDRKPELITTGGVQNEISVRKNAGYAGSFIYGPLTQFTLPHTTSFVHAMDADNDGRTDVVIGSPKDSSVLIVRNVSVPGSIVLDTPIRFRLSGVPVCAAIDDMDGNGKPDIIVSTSDTTGIDVLENRTVASIAFSKAVSIRFTDAVYQLCTGDVNGDETPDIIATDILHHAIGIFQNMSSVYSPVPINADWNLLSLPRRPADPTALHVFPNALQPFYGISAGGYTRADTLTIGEGYWALFSRADSVKVFGTSVRSCSQTIPTGERWVLFGSVTMPTPVGNISTIPPDAILSRSIWGYDGTSYSSVAIIEPGRAYWVYVVHPCTITLGQ